MGYAAYSMLHTVCISFYESLVTDFMNHSVITENNMLNSGPVRVLSLSNGPPFRPRTIRSSVQNLSPELSLSGTPKTLTIDLSEKSVRWTLCDIFVTSSKF